MNKDSDINFVVFECERQYTLPYELKFCKIYIQPFTVFIYNFSHIQKWFYVMSENYVSDNLIQPVLHLEHPCVISTNSSTIFPSSRRLG